MRGCASDALEAKLAIQLDWTISRRIHETRFEPAGCFDPAVNLLFWGQGGRRSPGFHRRRQQRPVAQAFELPRQVRGSGVAQPGLPLYPQALRDRQHAEAAKGVDGEGRRVAYGDLIGSWEAGLCHGQRGERLPEAYELSSHGSTARS